MPVNRRIKNQFDNWTEKNISKTSFYSAEFHGEFTFAEEILATIRHPPLSLLIYIYYRNTGIVFHGDNERLY